MERPELSAMECQIAGRFLRWFPEKRAVWSDARSSCLQIEVRALVYTKVWTVSAGVAQKTPAISDLPADYRPLSPSLSVPWTYLPEASDPLVDFIPQPCCHVYFFPYSSCNAIWEI